MARNFRNAEHSTLNLFFQGCSLTRLVFSVLGLASRISVLLRLNVPKGNRELCSSKFPEFGKKSSKLG